MSCVIGHFGGDASLVAADSNVESPNSLLQLFCYGQILCLHKVLDNGWDVVLEFIGEAVVASWQDKLPHFSEGNSCHPIFRVIIKSPDFRAFWYCLHNLLIY